MPSTTDSISAEPPLSISTPTPPLHVLPQPFTRSTTLEPLTQGAEALVYRTSFLTPSTPVVLKYRPPKPYRHPTLDKRLTKARLLAEARVLVKCRREGVKVPAVIGGDYEAGWLVLEHVGGRTVRKVLDEWVHAVKKGHVKEEESVEEQGGEDKAEIYGLMERVGRAVGRLHEVGVCHGDLTTSNLMLRDGGQDDSGGPGTEKEAEEGRRRGGRPTVSAQREAAITEADSQPPPSSEAKTSLAGDVILIDFGLATQTVQDEDRAVDLYVLERAFAATHPAAEPLFREVLRCYGESFKGAKTVLRRLEDVRLRGRKRSMLG